jgi:hypothetical protein
VLSGRERRKGHEREKGFVEETKFELGSCGLGLLDTVAVDS